MVLRPVWELLEKEAVMLPWRISEPSEIRSILNKGVFQNVFSSPSAPVYSSAAKLVSVFFQSRED